MKFQIHRSENNVCITESQVELLEKAYSNQLRRLDEPEAIQADPLTLKNLVEAGLIVPAVPLASGRYALTDFGKFVLRRHYRTARSPDRFVSARRNLPLIDVDHLD